MYIEINKHIMRNKIKVKRPIFITQVDILRLQFCDYDKSILRYKSIEIPVIKILLK